MCGRASMLCSIYARFPFSLPLIEWHRNGTGSSCSDGDGIHFIQFDHFRGTTLHSSIIFSPFDSRSTSTHMNLGWIVTSHYFEIRIVSLFQRWANCQQFNTMFSTAAKWDDNEDIFLLNNGDRFFLSCFLHFLSIKQHTSFAAATRENRVQIRASSYKYTLWTWQLEYMEPCVCVWDRTKEKEKEIQSKFNTFDAFTWKTHSL